MDIAHIVLGRDGKSLRERGGGQEVRCKTTVGMKQQRYREQEGSQQVYSERKNRLRKKREKDEGKRTKTLRLESDAEQDDSSTRSRVKRPDNRLPSTIVIMTSMSACQLRRGFMPRIPLEYDGPSPVWFIVLYMQGLETRIDIDGVGHTYKLSSPPVAVPGQ